MKTFVRELDLKPVATPLLVLVLALKLVHVMVSAELVSNQKPLPLFVT